PKVISRVIGNETVLLPVYRTSEEINCIYTLNKPAARVWEMLGRNIRVSALKRRILKEFDVSAAAADRELEKLLKELGEIKAII
ncbi:MAG: PqqD family protein, partial [Candidatus Omnitrophota bacterium]